MSFTVENLEKNMAKLTIEVPAEELEKALQQAYEKKKGRIALNGFRKGKAPRAVIEKVYGAGIFYEDAANILIPDAYAEAADESKLEIVAQPEIDLVQIEKGKPFIFTAEVTLKPDVVLGDYLGVEIEPVDDTVTDADIDAELEKIRDQNSRLVSVTDRAVKDGDQTVIDFEGFVDGKAFDGGKGTDYPLTIGSHSFIDNFEEQLIGANIGGEVEVNVTFPENYQAKELAGKPALFKVTVKEIKTKELPALDDEFAKDVSEFDTLAEYRDDVKEQLSKRRKEAAKQEKENKAVAKAVENATIEIPEAMIKSQVNSMVNDLAQRLQMQGLSIEQYIQYMGSNPQAFMDSMKPEAEQIIRNTLVLEAVAKAENIEATDEDYAKEIERMAEMYKMETDKVKEMLGEAEEKQIRSDLEIQKAAELIAEKAVETASAKTE